MMQSLCNQWEFTPEWTEPFLTGEGKGVPVCLPHDVQNLPQHYADHMAYQKICGYRRKLVLNEAYQGKRLFLQFDGAAHIADVFFNGRQIATHRCGYTAFRVEITDVAIIGQENLLCVRLDTTENSAVPPFGFVIDYLTYGGLYREAWLDVREQDLITDVFVYTPDLQTARVQMQTQGRKDCRLSVLDGSGNCVLTQNARDRADLVVEGARVWSCEDPYLYTLRCELLDTYGAVVDVSEVPFGFRTAEFKADGFYLNGKKTFLRGLNRHQCYPYIGYAAPASLQWEDARILKEELSCNAVRTSHYPQSHHFLQACDKLGLLVFTEIPGWQHLGDELWKEQVCENVREMVLQYRNHTSIILWGVRVNESLDDDALYSKTNAIAHDLDPSRSTSGVRYLEKSSLLEDVYAFNDFSHTGNNPGCKPKKKVTPDLGKALLISECNGHMFPTKSFDTWQRRQEHALRHASVQNAAMASGEHAGCFGWCMFDYATHKDFGSGDRICYHGVMDVFRNPKLAAAVYASQGEAVPVLEIGSSMDIGDYPAGQIGDVYAFTNADEVRLYKNGNFVTTLSNSHLGDGLPHGPQKMDDTIGCLLQTQEGFPEAKADLMRKCLLAVAKKGLAGLSLWDGLRMAWAMLHWKLTMDDAVALYGKYVGNWGGEATVWRFDAIRNGEVVASVTKTPSCRLHLQVRASHTVLHEGDTYDIAAVRIRILDEYGNGVPYAQLPLKLTLTGVAELVGPDMITAEGGMTGTYIRTCGQKGTAQLTVCAGQCDPVTVQFTVE